MSDIISKVLGNFGIWQLRTTLIVFLCKIPASWFMACIIFTAPALRENEWYCKPPPELSDIDSKKWIEIAHPKYTKNSIDHCHIYANAINRTNSNNFTDIVDSRKNNYSSENKQSSDNKLIDCETFVYGSHFYSLLMQFNLVCDRDILLAWSQYWHLFGILLGSVAAIKMMLFISPKNVMLSGMILQIICGILTGFLPDFNLNCLFRVNSAICCAIMFVSGQAIFQDITGGKYRIGVTTLYDTFWSVGLFILPGLSNLFNHWSFIYIGITLPTLILIFLYPWISDAPRWLLKHNKIDECERILLESAEINDRSHMTMNLRQELEIEAEKLKAQLPPSTWCELWNGPHAIRNLFATHIAWAIYVINFMGLLLNIRSFPNGREYLGMNTIITGISEVIGCFLAMYFSCNSQNKWMIAGIFNIIAGLIGCSGWLFPDNWDSILAMSMWMLISSIAKCGTSFAQSMLAACTAELVSVPKKPTFIFSCIVFSRVWLLSAPFIGVFKRFHIALSLSAYCILSIIGGICLCVIRTPKASTSGDSITIQAATNQGFQSTELENIHNQDHQNSGKLRNQQQNSQIWTVPNKLENTKF